MNNTLERTRHSILSETQFQRLEKPTNDLVDSMISQVHNSPILLSEYLTWKEVQSRADIPITGDPVCTFIAEHVKNGRYPLSYFVPLDQQQTFTGSVLGTIGSNSR